MISKLIAIRCFVVGAVTLAMLTAQAPADASLHLDTTVNWNGSSSTGNFGEVSTATHGQTFTVSGTNTVLNSFTFYLDDISNPGPVDFAGYVAAWDGNKAMGPILFTSSAMSTTNNSGAGGFEEFTVNTGGISLVSGEQYVAFFSASNYFDTVTGTSLLGRADTPFAPYTGGKYVFNDNGSDFGALTTTNWGTNVFDLAFKMDFSDPSAVPEPTTFVVWSLLGMLGTCFFRRKHRS